MIVRRIVENDCPRIMELVRELAVFERAPEEVTVEEAHFVAAGFGDKPVWWGFAAEEAGVIIGFAIYYLRYSTWKGTHMYLEDLLVTEAWRSKGVGQQLLNAIIQEAADKKYSFIRWQVLEWNEPAIQFYKKNGAVLDSEWINCTVSVP